MGVIRKIDVEESKKQGRPIYIEISDGIEDKPKVNVNDYPAKTRYQYMTSGHKALMFYLSLFPLVFAIVIGYSAYPLLGHSSGPGIEPVPTGVLLALTIFAFVLGGAFVIGLTGLLFSFFKRIDISPYQKRIFSIFIGNNIVMLIFFAQVLFIPFTNDFETNFETVGGVVTGFFLAYWVIVFVEICLMQLRIKYSKKKRLMLALDIIISTSVTLIYGLLVSKLCFNDLTVIIVYNVISFVVFLIYNIIFKIMRLKKQVTYEYIEELDDGYCDHGINIAMMIGSNIFAILIIVMFLSIFNMHD